MILAQGLLEIFCSQGALFVERLSLKRDIIQSTFHRISWNVYQVIYIMYPNYTPDIMTLAQSVLQIFCSQSCFFIYSLDTMYVPNIVILAQSVLQILCSQCPLWAECLSEKGNNSVKFCQNFIKSYSGDLDYVPKL